MSGENKDKGGIVRMRHKVIKILGEGKVYKGGLEGRKTEREGRERHGGGERPSP